MQTQHIIRMPINPADEEWLADLMDTANLGDVWARRMARTPRPDRMRLDDLRMPGLLDLLDVDDTPYWKAKEVRR